ncbi:hypothetical protein A2U01_0087006, partial [Trifolium medium]|nr:hypothetical protein [Trifolium medium]
CWEALKRISSGLGALRSLMRRVGQFMFLMARCAGGWRVAPTRFL